MVRSCLFYCILILCLQRTHMLASKGGCNALSLSIQVCIQLHSIGFHLHHLLLHRFLCLDLLHQQNLLLLRAFWKFDKVDILLDFFSVAFLGQLLWNFQSIFDVLVGTFHFYCLDLLYSVNSFCPQFSIVDDWHISFLLKLEWRINCKLFSVWFSIRFCPSDFSWVTFHLKWFVTFGSTKSE